MVYHIINTGFNELFVAPIMSYVLSFHRLLFLNSLVPFPFPLENSFSILGQKFKTDLLSSKVTGSSAKSINTIGHKVAA